MPNYNLIQNFETTGYVATKFWKETRWSRISQKRIGHAFARNALVTHSPETRWSRLTHSPETGDTALK